MIFQRVYAARTVVLAVAVTAAGSQPVVGVFSDVEKIWNKFKNRFSIGEKRKKLPVDRSSSAVELEKLKKIARRSSDMNLHMAKFKALDVAARQASREDVFSPLWEKPKFDKADPTYGRPKEGSLTERRGIQAGIHIGKEIIQLCEVIHEHGDKQSNGTIVISFGRLFSIYVYISDKVVGMLLRARKHNMVAFPGEMLYQRRDDDVPITLLRSIDDVRLAYNQSNDPAKCLMNI